ncbi:hypothetical protein [Aquisalimonas sp.]|uniref:Flp family type IVb pilin n=1 Tax=Aquisalimonas sp. TaxID=1872621 RepID=UPI0025C2D59E|nr:hypothetical protein [Aquisalimonas sp.]
MKHKLLVGMQRFLREEEGTEVVEWALVAGLIVAVGAGIFFTIGEHVQTHLEALRDVIDPTYDGT